MLAAQVVGTVRAVWQVTAMCGLSSAIAGRQVSDMTAKAIVAMGDDCDRGMWCACTAVETAQVRSNFFRGIF